MRTVTLTNQQLITIMLSLKALEENCHICLHHLSWIEDESTIVNYLDYVCLLQTIVDLKCVFSDIINHR